MAGSRLGAAATTVFTKGLRSVLDVVGDGLASLVFSAPCRICGTVLNTSNRLPVCRNCLDSFQPLPRPLCRTCGRPFHSAVAATEAGPLCHLCRKGVYGFDLARSFAVYNDSMVRAITVLKYEAVTPLGNWFAARLHESVVLDTEFQAVDVVVPVPLDPSRLRQRGYNQAELVAQPLAKRLQVPLRAHLLMRTRPRPQRLKLTRRERWQTVRGAFVMAGGARVDKLRVLLVDDVFTTGATLDACARTLRRAGASRILGLTVARVVADWLSPGATREIR